MSSIGEGAFGGTPWYSNQPNGLVYAGKVAYKYKGTMPANTNIVIEDGTLGIAGSAFKNCSGLTSVTIPKSVTNIGDYAFYNCSSLTSVTVKIEIPLQIRASVFYDSNYRNATLYVPYGCKAAYEAANYWKSFKYIVEMAPPSPIIFADANVKALCVANWDTDGDGELCEAEAAAVTSLGSVFKNNQNITSFEELCYFTGLTSINDYAFSGCSSLTSVTIPNSVTSIKNSTFYRCSGLTSVTIPNSVTDIDGSAFAGCSGLTTIVVVSGNPKYDSRNGCKAIIETATNTLITGCKNTIIPNSVTSIGDDAFYCCSGLTSVTIGNSVTSIGSSAFAGCSGLTSVTIGNSVTSIGSSAFSGCSGLTSIEIPNSVTSIGSYAFQSCSGLTSIEIPNSVTSIGNNAFSGCSGLTSVTIPNSVTSIGGHAFQGCSGLTSVTIPNSVTSILGAAFYGCSSLTSVTVENETPLQIVSNVFSNRANATLYVPAGSKAAYEAADYWNEFKEIVEMGPDSEPGDVDGDGSIDVADIVMIIDVIAGLRTDPATVAAADVDGDGTVDVADIVACIDLIAQQVAGSPALTNRISRAAVGDYITAVMQGDKVDLRLNNQNQYTAFQMTVTLPEGLVLKSATMDKSRGEDHQLTVRRLNDQEYLLMGFSMDKDIIFGNSGRLLTLTTEGVANGEIHFGHILFATSDAESVRLDDASVQTSATGIRNIELGIADAEVFDLQGRKVNGNAKSGLYIVNGKKVMVK